MMQQVVCPKCAHTFDAGAHGRAHRADQAGSAPVGGGAARRKGASFAGGRPSLRPDKQFDGPTEEEGIPARIPARIAPPPPVSSSICRVSLPIDLRFAINHYRNNKKAPRPWSRRGNWTGESQPSQAAGHPSRRTAQIHLSVARGFSDRRKVAVTRAAAAARAPAGGAGPASAARRGEEPLEAPPRSGRRQFERL